MKSYLFAYGWLKRSHRLVVERNVPPIPFPFVGEGKLAGKLYLVTGYPGFVESHDLESWVYGEVFEITDEQVLHQLDVFERAFPVVTDQPEYIRKRLPVWCNGMEMDCWVYVFAKPIHQLQIIEEGVF